MTDMLSRIIEAFDKDDTAGSFLREDGEGGFASGIYRMAREIERLQFERDAVRNAALEDAAVECEELDRTGCDGGQIYADTIRALKTGETQ